MGAYWEGFRRTTYLVMNNTIANKFNSFKATLQVVDEPEFVSVWTGKEPEDFATGIAAVRVLLTGFASKGAAQSASITGDTKALGELRTEFEKMLHILSRATFQALKKLGRTDDAEKVNLTPTDLERARALALAGMGETVLDLAEPLSVAPAGGGEPLGKKSGVTAALVAKVDDLWDRFGTAVGAPVSARAKRKSLTSQLPDDARAIEAKFAELDDLVIQFGATELGQHFVNAWFNARQVVDLGRRAAKPKTVEPVK